MNNLVLQRFLEEQVVVLMDKQVDLVVRPERVLDLEEVDHNLQEEYMQVQVVEEIALQVIQEHLVLVLH
jgi:hypothetical protein